MPVSLIKALEYYHDDKTNDLFFVTEVVPSQHHGLTHVEVTVCFWGIPKGTWSSMLLTTVLPLSGDMDCTWRDPSSIYYHHPMSPYRTKAQANGQVVQPAMVTLKDLLDNQKAQTNACECGASKCGSAFHSDWCALYSR